MGIGDMFRRRPATKLRTLYSWRCSCGSHSRGGDLFEADAQDLAKQHRDRNGVGHPMPEVYAELVTVPGDWP